MDFWANTRPILLLSVGLVLFTALAVTTVAHLVVPGLPWAAALALGAVVAPPDAVAAIAIGRRVGMPARLRPSSRGRGCSTTPRPSCSTTSPSPSRPR